MAEVSIVRIEPELAKDSFDFLMRFVEEDRRTDIRKFRFYKDAQNALIGGILARAELCGRTGLKNGELIFSENEYGKKRLANRPEVHFNISHTANYVVCAIDDSPVGIDIEGFKDINLGIGERFFSPDENEYIMGGDPKSRTRRFFEVWTMKESRIKREGKGMSTPLNSFSVFAGGESPRLYYHKTYEDENVISHICTTNESPPTTRVIPVPELIRAITDANER